MSKLENMHRLIDFKRGIQSPVKRNLFKMIEKPVDHMLAINALNQIYSGFSKFNESLEDQNFFHNILHYMKVRYEVAEDDLKKIPTEGPVLVVANHPLGGLDGIVLGAMLTRVRSDVRILVNSLLWEIVEMRPWLITVNPFGGKKAMRENLRGMKESIRYLQGNGCVGTFPSGTVSHLQLDKRQVTDPEWNPNTARFVRLSKATVVPVHFDGKNSVLFQFMGLIHPLLRTALLPREFVGKLDEVIRVSVGDPISYNKLKSFETDEALTDFLRLNTYVLRNRTEAPVKKWHKFPVGRLKAPRKDAPLINPIDVEKLKKDIAGLPESNCIVSKKQFSVYYAKAHKIPNVLREIGRLREKTFREVQEGTGKSLDIDEFDNHYLHLFMWDHEANAIVGAYRMGLSDEIIKEYGVSGLYTSTLFKYKNEAIDFLNPGLELGRSFITSEYQRKPASLALIWKAIMLFVVKFPKYNILFGSVSITQDYHRMSKDLMVQFLRSKNNDPDPAAMIKAKRPPKRAKLNPQDKQILRESLRDIDDVSALVSGIETDKKGVPTLLRHYLKLNGQILSFNIDPDFGECLDGLIMVDFKKTDIKFLKHYMGNDGWQAFAEYHGMLE